MHVYDFGEIKLHAYKTCDYMSDEVFIIEKNGKAVIIESPCFFDNIVELEKYVTPLNVGAMLLSYHAAGGSFLKNTPKYGTDNAKIYGEQGGGKMLIDSFYSSFGAAFDNSVHTIDNVLKEGETVICGIEFIITKTREAYDIEIPEINAVYTHMLGHDLHSIVAGENHADEMRAQLESYIKNGVTLILTSHYTPEDLKDAETKINYLAALKQIAKTCSTAQQFKSELKKNFPDYGGENYLDMTADMFYNK